MKSLKFLGMALMLGASTSIVFPQTAMGQDAHKSETAMADEVKLGDLSLSGGWTRATPKSARVGAGFFTITNHGDTADRLLKVMTSLADLSEIHLSSMSDGVMKMRKLDEGLEIPAGGTVILQPGGLHLMLIGLKTPISKGEDVELHLTFEKAGMVMMKLHAAPIGAAKPMMSHN